MRLSASFANMPAYGDPAPNSPRPSMGCRKRRPCSRPSSKSSLPNAGARCTMPEPSPSETNCAANTRRRPSAPSSRPSATRRPSRKARGSTPHVSGRNSGSYATPASASPRSWPTDAPSAGAAASTSDSASTSRSVAPSSVSCSTTAYVASGATASAVLPGSVHGVVVHATKNVGTPSARRSAAGAAASAGMRNFTNTDGSSVPSRYPCATSWSESDASQRGQCGVTR